MNLIADDLSGAMDTGLQMRAAGIKTRILLQNSCAFAADEALVFDTETRNLPQQAAKEKVSACLKHLSSMNRSLEYKKVDSTLRGPVGAEIEACLEEGDFDFALLCSVLPQSGRFYRRGVLTIWDTPITDTDIGQDPYAPVRFSHVSEILGQTTALNVECIANDEHLSAKLASFRGRIAVADAESYEDLQRIVQAIRQCGRKVLPCGSAGLLNALMQAEERNADQTETMALPNEGILVLSGSPAVVTHQQIALTQLNGIPMVGLNLEDERLYEIARQCADEKKSLIINGAPIPKNELRSLYGTRELLEKEGERIPARLSVLFRRLCKLPFTAVMIIGGETAYAILSAERAGSIRLVGTAADLIPIGRLQGGTADGILIITKAGGLGSEDALVQILTNPLRVNG